MAESGWWVSNNKISILLKKGWFSNVKVSLKWEEYPFTWLSSLYNSFNDLLDFFICNIAVCADDTTFYSKCDEAFDLLQQLELASELENLNLIYETLWNRTGSGLLISMLENLSLFRLSFLVTLVLLMWIWVGLFLEKNHLLGCWVWLSLLNWIRALTLSLLLKLPPRKLELWFVLWSSFSRDCSVSL